MKNFWTEDRLVKRWAWEPSSIENELINAYRLYRVTKDEKLKADLRENILDFVSRSFHPETGLLLNHANPTVLARHPDISHDQITIVVCISIEFGLLYHRRIWNDIKWFKYDGRLLNPRDWIFYGIVNNSKIAYMLSPILMASMLWTFLMKYDFRFYEQTQHRNRTQRIWAFKRLRRVSGPMLWDDRVPAFKRHKRFSKFFSGLTKYFTDRAFGSWQIMYEWYYDDADHLIRKQL